jgi:hypothetical protein
VIVGVLVVIMLIGITAGALGSAMRDNSTTTTTAESAEPSAGAKELADLLDKRDDATYHARYQGSSPDTGSIVLETWQEPPLSRLNSEVQSQGQVVQASTLVLASSEVHCARSGEEPWRCQETAITDPSAADPLAEMRSRLDQASVTASDAQVGGVAVRCFRFAIDGTTDELCLRADTGIPVSVTSGDSRLDLVEVQDAVDPTAFDPPAPPG